MATAGEKFFAELTNGELGYMARTTGVRIEEWETEVSGIQVNGVVLVVASKRLALKDGGKPLTLDEVDNLTPAATQDRLVETLTALGYKDDEDDAEDFSEEG